MEFELDSGNTAFMLTAASLVLLMTPGLAFFYGGMVRGKSVLNMMMMSFGAIGVAGLIWVLYGYSAVFGGDLGGGWLGNPFEFFGLQGATDDQSLMAASGVPFLVAAGYQATFAIITVALISGAVADRMKFGAWLVFTAVWVTVVYLPLAHWVWGGGLLSATGLTEGLSTPIDFAGGTVVHINAGTAGWCSPSCSASAAASARRPCGPTTCRSSCWAQLLWFGWFGFNAGSEFAADNVAGRAWLNTLLATGIAMLAWLATEKVRDGHATSLGAASGIVAGLVAITPAAAAVDTWGAIAIGIVAGVLCALAVGLKFRFGYDDSLDVVGVHLVGGLVGTILIGFFATDANSTWYPDGAQNGLFYGGGLTQLATQTIVALAAVLFSFTATYVIALILKATIGLRVSDEAEVGGIDLAVHAETAYETLASAPAS